MMVRSYLCACFVSVSAQFTLIRSDISFWFILVQAMFLDLACGFCMRRSMASSRAVVELHCRREGNACIRTL